MPVATNVSDSPVLIDSNGHTLGGGERGEVDESKTQVKEAVESGRLVLEAKPKGK